MYSFQDGGRGMRTVTPQDSAGVKYEDFQSVCQIELREIAKDSCGSNSTHINLLFGHKKLLNVSVKAGQLSTHSHYYDGNLS